MPKPLKVILHNDQTDQMMGWLNAAYRDVEVLGCNTYTDLPGMIDAHHPDVVYSIRFAGTPGFPREALFGPNGPRWLAIGGAGTDHLGHWDTNATTVTNAAGVAADMMAEYAFGGMLHFSLDIAGLQRDQATQTWAARMVSPLKGKTLLIVGLGNTGRAVAARAKAFGMHVIGTRARPLAAENVDEVHGSDSLMQILPRADFVVICTPLTPGTKGLIGVPQLRSMKSGVVIVDVSRGGVVDQNALAQALNAGHVAGAALDVFEVEPLPQNSPFWSMPNVIVSPHCSSVHQDWERASFDLFIENIGLWRDINPLRNVVDPIRGY